MKTLDFNTTIYVGQTPQEAFKGINNPVDGGPKRSKGTRKKPMMCSINEG